MAQSFLRSLADDPAIDALFSEQAEIEAMLAFEAALAEAEAAAGVIPQDAVSAIAQGCRAFQPDIASLHAGIVKDGVVVPSFVAALRAQVDEPQRKWLHFGATSQDAIDTALVMRLKRAVVLIETRLLDIIAALETLRARDGRLRLMAQTRMQQALPFTAADKVDTWIRPLQRHQERLLEILPRLLVVQFGGPVGTRSDLDGKGDAIAGALAERLGLGVAAAWHTARDNIAEFANWLSLLSGALGKIGADVALMAQNEIGAVRIAGGGASSAMPHKSNPVAAEVLVALGRFNAGLLGTLHQALVHENERSGAAWTIEWLVLPQMLSATAAGLAHAAQLIGNLTFKDLK
jgi:3-carboxy-cis,cis-muconate cycloisomerase